MDSRGLLGTPTGRRGNRFGGESSPATKVARHRSLLKTPDAGSIPAASTKLVENKGVGALLASVSTMSPHSGMLRRTPSTALTLQD